MKLSPSALPGTHLVTGYAAGEVRLAERRLTAAALVTADTIADWPGTTLATLNEATLAPLFALAPELVLLATGVTQRFPPPAVLGLFLGRGIGCEVMATDAACRTYNVLVAEDRRVALALLFA
jgi:uncharacterized protein